MHVFELDFNSNLGCALGKFLNLPVSVSSSIKWGEIITVVKIKGDIASKALSSSPSKTIIEPDIFTKCKQKIL